MKDWEHPDVFRQTPEEDGIWDGIKFTFEKVEECDFLVVFTRPPYDINVCCPLGNVWLVSLEPPTPYHRFLLKSYKYFDKVFSQHQKKKSKNHFLRQGGLPWHINKTYKELMSLKPEEKKDRVSAIVSNLDWMKGHQVRLNFINYIQNRKFDLDFFGRGVNPIDDKFEALYPYKYSIAIENSNYNNYWTEKISDCFLSWTIPIYYGCRNIFDYFPEKSIILIDPTKPKEALKLINEALSKDYWSKNLDALQEAREKVLNEYQIFPYLSKEIKLHQNSVRKAQKHWVKIPYNPAPGEGAFKPSLFRKIEYKVRKFVKLKPY